MAKKPRPKEDITDETTSVSTTPPDLIAQSETRIYTLEKTKGPGENRKWVLEEEQLVVGRMEGVDIQLDSSQVSRRHMILKKSGNEFSCVDLNSRNGIYLNDIKVHSAVLKDGDIIQLGDVQLVFHEGT